jgi:hypothetical protein
MAEKASVQGTSLTPLMYASANSVSALLPLCVRPLQKLILRISIPYNMVGVPALWEPTLKPVDID